MSVVNTGIVLTDYSSKLLGARLFFALCAMDCPICLNHYTDSDGFHVPMLAPVCTCRRVWRKSVYVCFEVCLDGLVTSSRSYWYGKVEPRTLHKGLPSIFPILIAT